MAIETLSESRSFGGIQGVYRHASDATGTDMTFAVYLPPAAKTGPVPVLIPSSIPVGERTGLFLTTGSPVIA